MISERRLWLLLAAGLLLSSALLARFHGLEPRGTDDQYYYAQARSLLVDGDLDLRNELGELTPRPENVHTSTAARWDEPTATGLVACKYPIGAPLLQLPFLALGVGVGALIGRAEHEAPGYERPAYLAWHLGLLCYALLAVACTRRFVVRALGLSERAALLGSIGAFLGGPLYFYAVGDAYMAHLQSGLLVAALLALVVPRSADEAPPMRLCFGVGVLFGLALATRLTNAVYAISLLALAAPRQRGLLARCALLVLGTALAFSPQVLAWRAIYGPWMVQSYRDEGFDFWNPELYANLLSVRAGLFAWAPLWALGLVPALLRFRALRIAWLPGLFLVYWGSCWWCWWWGDSYGGRAYVTLYPLVAAGLAMLFAAQARAARAAAWTAIVLGALWSAFMIYRVEVTTIASRARSELLGERAVR